MLKYVALFALLSAPVLSYSTGAPKDVCYSSDPKLDLFPQHGAAPKTGKAPYTLQGPSTVEAGSNIELKLTGAADTFLGFMLQARLDGPNGMPVGSFVAGRNAQTLDCKAPRDTLTHTKSDGVKEVNFKWTAPANLKGKKVVFVATVAKTGFEFWLKGVTKNVSIV